MRLVIEATDLPGRQCRNAVGSYDGVQVGVQRGRSTEQLVSADAPSARWELEIAAKDGGADLSGPHVQGRPGARFVYLVWDAAVHPNGSAGMFRRLKIPLDPLHEPVRAALSGGGVCTVRLGLIGADGTPRCGGLKTKDLSWSEDHEMPAT